jgi:hypothetical protein
MYNPRVNYNNRDWRKNMGSQAVTTRNALLCAFALLALALPAWAAGDEAAAQPQQPTTAPPAAAEAAPPVASVDPKGGKLPSPTEEQRAAAQAALAEALSRSWEGLVEEVLPDGSVMVDLQGRFQEVVAVRVAPDGTQLAACVSQAEAATAPPVPATQQPPAAVTE